MIVNNNNNNEIVIKLNKEEWDFFKRLLIHADHDMKLFPLAFFNKEKDMLKRFMELDI